jgi:hypothetical protein
LKGLTSEGLVGAVAERTLLGMLTVAEIDGTIRFSLIRDRRKRGTLVGTVAEGLRFAVSARAPVVGLADFDEDGNRGLLRNVRGGHDKKMTEGR